MLSDRKASKMNRKKLNIVSLERDESGEIESMVVTMERADLDVTDEGTKLTAQNLMDYVKEFYENQEDNDDESTDNTSSEAKANYILNTITLPQTITSNLTLPNLDVVTWKIKISTITASIINDGSILDISQATSRGVVLLEAACTIDGISSSRTFRVFYNKTNNNSNTFTWNQMDEEMNSCIYFVSGAEFDTNIHVEVWTNNDLITCTITGNDTREVVVEFDETSSLKNSNKINQTDTFNFNIRVSEVTNPANTLKSENVTIYYNYYQIPDFYGELTQEVGNRQSIYFTLVPRKDVPIYLEVYNYESALFSIIQPYVNPNTNNIEFGFIEHPDLNSSYFTGPLNAEFLVRVYSDEARTNLICTVPGNITYNFVQIRPID